MKVFLIDDEKVVNFITRRLIAQVGADIHDITDFTDAYKALDAISAENPDLCFLDLNMPVLNGWAFLDHMKEKGIYNKVIILSSSVSTIDQERAKDYSNVLEFIEKPVKREDLKRCFGIE